MDELTICTVSFHHDDFVLKNVEFSARLNPESASLFRWIVADNTPGASTRPRNAAAHCRVEWIEGEDAALFQGPSDHHAAAINKVLARVDTPYLLVIDPDFFILRRNWVPDLLRHMKERRLAVLGAPWNPVWYSKPRYVPACAHCLFLDLRLFERPPDFSPWESRVPTRPAQRIPAMLKKPLEAVLHAYRMAWRNRSLVGRDKDTAHLIAAAIERLRLPFECFVPVFDPVEDFPGPGLFRYLDRFFEDARRYVPSKKSYFSESGFEHFGMESARRIGCEEFLWKNAPFGIHFRGQPKRMTGEFAAAKARLFDYLDEALAGV